MVIYSIEISGGIDGLKAKFSKMRKKYLIMSKRYQSLEDLKNDCPKADVYMTGE